MNKNTPDRRYGKQRVEWDHIALGTQYSRSMWQLLALATTMLSILSTGAAFYFAKSSQYIPYIIEVDTHGRVRFQGVPEHTEIRDERITRSIVVEFVASARMVTADLNLQEKAVDFIKAHIAADDPAASFLVAFFSKNEKSDPYKRAKDELVKFSLTSAIPITKNTWQVDWLETVTDHSGSVKERYNMRASVTVYFADKAILALKNQHINPTNMFIHDLSWSRTLQEM